MRGAGEDRVPQTLEVQGERGTTVGEEQRGTVPRGGVVPCGFPRAGATRRLAEIRKSDSNSKPRGEFQNFSCGCSLGVSTCRKVIFAGPGARTAPRRSQEPGAKKEWAVSANPGRAPANVLSSLATTKPPARRPRS